MYEKACEHLKRGGIIIYPTDTLWGMGSNPFSESSILKLFELKGIKEPRPISVAFPDFGKASEFTSLPHELSNVFPAPLTVIAESYSTWPYITLNRKMGLRIPDNSTALQLLKECGPLTATSANIHGGPNMGLDEIKDTFGGEVRIIEGEEPKYMEPSTIIDIVEHRIIRAGAYPANLLRSLLTDRGDSGHPGSVLPGNPPF